MNDNAQRLRDLLIRNFNDVALTRELREPLYDTQCARLATGTAAQQLGASIDILAPGMRGCPYHLHHAQEELFIVLEGSGTLRVAGELLPVKAGDVVFIPAGCDYPHQIINSSPLPMKFLSVSTRQRPELCEYPDSGKLVAWSGETRLTHRTAANLDYWDGEP